MNVRLLTPEDAKEYRELRMEALRGHPEAFASSYEEESKHPVSFYESRLQNPGSYTFGAFLDSRLAGSVSLVLESKKKLSHRASIFAMYVSPDVRKSGVGRKLMQEAIEMGRQSPGIRQIYLTVAADNQPAKNLYVSLGFQTFGVDRKALKLNDTYHDEELMVLFF